MHPKTTILLINLGTPKSPQTKDVRKYLSEFLNDRRVVDVPWLFRKILVNLIIVPFRAFHSAKSYRKLWTKNGFPILIYGEKVCTLLQKSLGENFNVELVMRYGEPSISKVLERIRNNMPEKLIVIPLYPQYASSTTGSTFEKVMCVVKSWEIIPEIKFVNQFFYHKGFIKTLAQNAKKHDLSHFDHFLFSYHGLPLRHIKKIHPDRNCNGCTCEKTFNKDEDNFCYKAACYETSRLLAKELEIPPEKYTVGFQSRMSKNWLTPFSDQIIKEQAQKGNKNLMVFSPSFIADCLETTIEIEQEYGKLFYDNGGNELVLVKSLNDNSQWIETLKDIVQNS